MKNNSDAKERPKRPEYPHDLLLNGAAVWEYVRNIPDDMTVVDMLRESFDMHPDIPALKYHAKSIVKTVSRKEFFDKVDTYAKAFHALGVKENECVPMYSPCLPELVYISLALIQIGAWGNALKLDMQTDDMDYQTSESKVAVVFDGMYSKVKDVFEKERFEKVVVLSALDSLSFFERVIGGIKTRAEIRKTGGVIPRTSKYVRRSDIMRLAGMYTKAPVAESVSDRDALGTYSSASSGMAKCAVASNRSIIANVKQAGMVNPSYKPGTVFLQHFPLVSTAACLLLFVPLDCGMTVIIDPLAVYEENYYESIIQFKVGFTLNTGPVIRQFFRLLAERGENVDLSHLQSLIVGAEGITKEDYIEYMEMLAAHGVKNPRSVLTQGYGLSECFSVLSSEVPHIQLPGDGKTRLINSVGMIYPGSKAGIYDREGRLLGANMPGEVWIDRENTPSLMSRYYLNPQLTEKNMPANGKFLYTGDIGELGEDGQLYIYGRKTEYLETYNGKDIYANTIANYILFDDETLDNTELKDTPLRFDKYVRYCFVNRVQTVTGESVVVGHIVLRDSAFADNMREVITSLNKKLGKYFPERLIPVGYRLYEKYLPVSRTTLKTDRVGLSACRDGFLCVRGGVLERLSFSDD